MTSVTPSVMFCIVIAAFNECRLKKAQSNMFYFTPEILAWQ